MKGSGYTLFVVFFMPSRGTALRLKLNSSSDLRKCKYSKYCNFVSLDFYLSKIAVDFRYTSRILYIGIYFK